MSHVDPKVTRRKFMLAGSAVAATPLLAELAVVGAHAASAENTTAAGAEFAKGTKVYFIMDQCIGCQVCRANCPVQAIRFGNCRNEIMQSKCIHCGTCYEACHVSNISATVVA
jgi:ferredoxin